MNLGGPNSGCLFFKTFLMSRIVNFVWMLGFLVLTACNSSNSATEATDQGTESTTTAATSAKLSVADFKAKLESLSAEGQVQLLDVRTPGEFAAGAIDGAANVNVHDADFKEQLQKYDKSKPIMIYCKSGGRSASAANICKRMGFKEIYDLSGGYTAWSRQ